MKYELQDEYATPKDLENNHEAQNINEYCNSVELTKWKPVAKDVNKICLVKKLIKSR